MKTVAALKNIIPPTTIDRYANIAFALEAKECICYTLVRISEMSEEKSHQLSNCFVVELSQFIFRQQGIQFRMAAKSNVYYREHLVELCARMRDPKQGLQSKLKEAKKQEYNRQYFSGADFVDWLLKNVTGTDLRRDQSLKLF
jgi:hypothetical protein